MQRIFLAKAKQVHVSKISKSGTKAITPSEHIFSEQITMKPTGNENFVLQKIVLYWLVDQYAQFK